MGGLETETREWMVGEGGETKRGGKGPRGMKWMIKSALLTAGILSIYLYSAMNKEMFKNCGGGLHSRTVWVHVGLFYSMLAC